MPEAPAQNQPRPLGRFRESWRALTLYERFEQAVILGLTGVIAVIIVSALWNLILRVALSLVLADVFDPTDPAVFQTVFGAIFTVIIALEFKRSILVVAERRFGVVQVRAVILIAIDVLPAVPAKDKLDLSRSRGRCGGAGSLRDRSSGS